MPVPQDPNPTPWGAMDRFQAHFIVRKSELHPGIYLARTHLVTRGRFASKTLQSVSWDGPGSLACALNQDDELNAMIMKRSVHDATIFVEPTDDVVRIHGKWKNHLEFGIDKEQFEIYDRIAGHIRSVK